MPCVAPLMLIFRTELLRIGGREGGGCSKRIEGREGGGGCWGGDGDGDGEWGQGKERDSEIVGGEERGKKGLVERGKRGGGGVSSWWVGKFCFVWGGDGMDWEKGYGLVRGDLVVAGVFLFSSDWKHGHKEGRWAGTGEAVDVATRGGVGRGGVRGVDVDESFPEFPTHRNAARPARRASVTPGKSCELLIMKTCLAGVRRRDG